MQKINSSDLRTDAFMQWCRMVNIRPIKMILSCPTRWDSAYNMLIRALYLRKAIDRFVLDDSELERFRLNEREWEMCGLLVTILMPFKKASTALQSASRPAIDEVFWTYETLFNKIDMVKSTFALEKYANKDWVEGLHGAVDAMAGKLRKYYDATEKPFVYPNGVILEPNGKLMLFKQQTWEPHYTDTYSDACREHFIKHYQLIAPPPSAPVAPSSRKRKLADFEDEHNDYRTALNKLASNRVSENEYDRYLNAPAPYLDSPGAHGQTLKSWKQLEVGLPRLALMARDTFAVPATGAGVDRQFSKSGRIATWSRSRLHPETIGEMMRYKNYLSRIGEPLLPRKTAKFNPEIGEEPAAEDGMEDSENEENHIRILEWEKEWWQKADAQLRI